MVDFERSILHGLFDEESLVAERDWKVLREGVFISPIYEVDDMGPRAAFLRYTPGSSVPNHVHQGFEHILILHGSQMDGTNVYDAGTLVIHSPGSNHQITSTEGCVALGIWEKPVKFP